MMKNVLFFSLIAFLLVSCVLLFSETPNVNGNSELEVDIIVPYISSSKEYYSQYGKRSLVNSYGFCNLQGESIIEPQNDISVLTCHTANDGFSFYEVGIGQSEQSTYANGFDPMKTLIIPADGKWCVELDEIGWWKISAGDGAIFASLDYTHEGGVYDNWILEAKTLVYDYYGNLIKEFGPSKFVSDYSESYKDCVIIELLDDSFGNTTSIYIDSKGEEVVAPEKIPYDYEPFNTDFEDLPFTEDGYDFEASSEDRDFVVYVVGETDYDFYKLETDKRVAYLYDRVNKEVLRSFHGNCGSYFLGNDDRFVYMYNYDNIECGNTYNYCLYDTEKRKLVIDNAEDIQHFSVCGKDFFAASYKNKAVLYNSEMKKILTTYFE